MVDFLTAYANMQNRKASNTMKVYITTITEHTLPVNSYVIGVYVTRALAEIAGTRVCKLVVADATATVTDYDVIGFPTSDRIETIRNMLIEHITDTWHAEVDQLCNMALTSTDTPRRPTTTSSWEGQVDRQGGSFTTDEIYDQKWR